MSEAITAGSFHADAFGIAYAAVFPATSTDQARPVLYRAVHAEHFARRGLRLTATDSYMLLTTWLPNRGYDGNPPTLRETADATMTIRDVDKRLLSLANYARKIDDEEEEHIVTVRTSKGDPVIGQLDNMEGRVVKIDLDRGAEILTLPIIDGYPRWQTIYGKWKREGKPEWSIISPMLKRVGDAASAIGGIATIRHGKDSARIEIEAGDTIVHGLFTYAKRAEP